MSAKYSRYWLIVPIIVLMSGCASYRTDTDVSFSSTEGVTPPKEIIITKDSLLDRKYKSLGPLQVKVKKLTIFHKNPTEEQAQVALAAKAKKLGADAVINVTYKSGIGWTSWGVITAKGIAIKFTEN